METLERSPRPHGEGHPGVVLVSPPPRRVLDMHVQPESLYRDIMEDTMADVGKLLTWTLDTVRDFFSTRHSTPYV